MKMYIILKNQTYNAKEESMNLLTTGCIKAILEKYSEPIIKGVVKISKDEWEKFKVEFDIAFIKYIKNSYDKYSKIKTLLYRTEPKYIYDFFEVPTLEKGHGHFIKADNANDILDISRFIIIQGTGGIGKSTLMKHLFISELQNKDLIPIFIELKDINDCTNEYEISDIIFEKLSDLGSKLNKDYLEYALKSGCFLFLLDGYDEILTDKKDYFFKRLDSFCDKYSKNYYVISSRPYSEFVEFQRFTVLSTCSLNKGQAISLVKRIEFDEDIKERFIKALDDGLYEKHESFASNPLLLNIMLMTFDNYAEIPEKLHLFYSNAFETLYSKHDATKAGYKRELHSMLSYDTFKKVFSYFCFITYAQGKIEFSYDDLVTTFKRVSISKVVFEIDDYIYDLVNSLCVLYRDGLNYKFAHRSFQEYFTAVFLKELSDEAMKQMGLQLIKKDPFRVSNDDVFDMLYDMAEERFEQNILLPALKEYEQNCTFDNKYDFYFRGIVYKLRFGSNHTDGKIVLWLNRENAEDMSEFIYQSTNHYIVRTEERNVRVKKAEIILLEYMKKKKGYSVEDYITMDEILEDKELYELVRGTWLGEMIETMANLNNMLSQKQKEAEIDLTTLLI